MMKRSYTKPALTYLQQVEKLQLRGMIIEDKIEAAFNLQHINYYRLGAYWLPFELDHDTHQFKPDTKFEDILNLYTFDRELRLLVIDAIERIEISARSQWAYYMGHNHGAHAHLDHNLAIRSGHWRNNMDDLQKELNRSDEIFIEHFSICYAEATPPIWAVCEVMSLGLLSRWYANLKPMRTRRAIASVYQLDEDVLSSWLHHLSTVRNICAHHSRFWSRNFTILPQAPKTKPAKLFGQFVKGQKTYNTFVILLYLMDIISPDNKWRNKLTSLLNSNQNMLQQMGFPSNWKESSFWQ